VPLTRVDILFVVDDSPSTSPKQAELLARFPQFVTGLDALAAAGWPVDYHLGVITPDLGAGGYVDTNCKPGGLGGRLQRIGREAPVGCEGPRDNFIVYDQITGTNNLPPGRSLSETWGCMAAVGDSGCGFEQVLEATYRALHDDIPENRGFRRDDALLVVFFLTDEDDCSADDSSDVFSAPVVQPPDGLGYRRSFRCTRYGVAFDGPNGPQLVPYGSSNGPIPNPRPARIAEGAKLIEVDKYVELFAGTNVLVGSLAGPPTSFETVLANPNTALEYTPCSEPISDMCQPVLEQSCVNGGFFADPAVRLDAVVRSVPSPRRVEGSICESSYQRPLERLAQQIGVAVRGVRCVDGVLPDATKPDCIVEDVVDGVATALPSCDVDASRACWRLSARARQTSARRSAHATAMWRSATRSRSCVPSRTPPHRRRQRRAPSVAFSRLRRRPKDRRVASCDGLSANHRFGSFG
jgi:hypothetical protein